MGGEEPDPRFVASWVKDNIGVRVRQDPQDPTKYDYFLLGSWMPQASIRMLTHPLEAALAQLTPAIKMPYALAFGRPLDDPERKIAQFEGQPGGILGFENIPGGKSMEYFLRSFSILSEIDKQIPGQAHRVDRDAVSRILGLALGARSQRVDVEKGRNWYLYGLTKDIGAMKAAYDKAIAGGYTGEAEQIKRILLRKYREREQLGQPTRGEKPKERPSETLLRGEGLNRAAFGGRGR